jgi:hypothetical protein
VAAYSGGWISGPSANAEQVPAEHVRAGDRLIHDGQIVEVDDIRHGWYWFNDGHAVGLAIGWRAVTGQS